MDDTVSKLTFRVVNDLTANFILGIPWLRDKQTVLDFGCVNFGKIDRDTVYWDTPKQSTSADVTYEHLD